MTDTESSNSKSTPVFTAPTEGADSSTYGSQTSEALKLFQVHGQPDIFKQRIFKDQLSFEVPTPIDLFTGRRLVRARVDQGKNEILDSSSEAPLAGRAYPHIMEDAQPALTLLMLVLDDARSAFACFNEGDISGLGSFLRKIAVGSAAMHPLTTFNESFGAVISFIRRATLSADASNVERTMVSSLLQALSQVFKNPLVDLASAAEIIELLEQSGWNARHIAVESLLALLISDQSTRTA